MKHVYPKEEWIQIDTVFGDPTLDMPPQRRLWNIQHEGYSEKLQRPYTFKIAKISMNTLRSNFHTHYPRDLPPVKGNKELQQYWVHSMWEAMYNPIHIRWVKQEDFLNHPKPEKRKDPGPIEYKLLHGHHRLRLLDALDADHIYVIMVTGHHHAHEHPPWIKERNKYNGVAPRRGTRSTICSNCGRPVGVSSRKLGDFNIPRWYICPNCGHRENYQPYPERI